MHPEDIQTLIFHAQGSVLVVKLRLVWLTTFFIPSVEIVPQNKRELKIHLKTDGKRKRLSFNGQTWQRESRTAVQSSSYFVFHILYFPYNFTLHKLFSAAKIWNYWDLLLWVKFMSENLFYYFFLMTDAVVYITFSL